MKIAVCATAKNIDAPLDPRFGRCRQFVIVDTEDMSFEALANQAAAAGHGAGIEAAQTVAEAGCDAVIAGSFGPNATEALSQGGLKMYRVLSGTVREAVEAVKAGSVEEVLGPNVDAHDGDNSRPA